MLLGNVIITGGTGFLGRGILRRAQKEDWPAQFTVYSRDETKQDECRKRFPHAQYILGDVRDVDRLSMACRGQDIIIHTAAVKYVPDAERNVNECVDVNVLGTRAVLAQPVEKIVCISTDKAARPTNVYGMTKAIGERLVCEAARFSSSLRVATRYGNVIGSTGSVIPAFFDQLRRLGYIEVTDPDMTRFWMSIDEAIDCILEALFCASGTIVIPKARAASIGAVAEAITKDEDYKVIGKRPGEKMHEELVHEQESTRTYSEGDYYYLTPNSMVESLQPPYSYASNKPREWITGDELMVAYEDAKCV